MYSKGFVKNHEFYDDFDKASVTNTEYTFYKLSNSRLTLTTLKSLNQQPKPRTTYYFLIYKLNCLGWPLYCLCWLLSYLGWQLSASLVRLCDLCNSFSFYFQRTELCFEKCKKNTLVYCGKKSRKLSSELETLEWWINRLMLNPLFFLISS